jgi:uncharacterized protein YjiS (DUF1127 family)
VTITTQPVPAGAPPASQLPQRARHLATLARRAFAWLAGLSAGPTTLDLAEFDDRMLRDIGLRRSRSRQTSSCHDIAAAPPPPDAGLISLVDLNGSPPPGTWP